jgi:hypothetical protein
MNICLIFVLYNLHVCQAHYYGVVSVREALHPFLFMTMSETNNNI